MCISPCSPDGGARGGLERASQENAPTLPAGSEEHRLAIKGDGSASISGVMGSEYVWRFPAIPDRAPTIDFIKDPERQAGGALRMDYKMDDDYGVVEAKAVIALKDAADAAVHPLYGAPEFPLSLPQMRTRCAMAQPTRDLTEPPWAGADVTVTLTAKDEAGNEGRSAAREIALPERIFVKPLPPRLIGQGR